MLNPGDRFGDYTVVRLLGKGGMGAVYLLENAEGAEVAAKILDPASAGDHESRRRFLREAELALGVKHPNLVETYDVGEDPDTGLCYILMEYVSGGSLADRLKQGPLPINDAIGIVYQVASVLELARQRGVVHRDIKPANIMFGADGKAKLADLGIARGGLAGTETTVTQTGMMIGTPAYMAPEQMLDAHHVDTRADIYSLGVVFYEMLTGERPNKDDTVVQLMAKAVAGEPIPDVRTMRPEVSASLAELVSLMCAMKADERVATPTEVTTALAQIVHGREVTIRRKAPKAVRTTSAPQAVRSRKPFPWKALIPVGLLAGLAAAFFALAPKREETKPPQDAPVVKREIRTLVPTNVVERTIVENRVATNGLFDVNAGQARRGGNVIPARQPTYRLRKVSELEPRVQKQLKEMASKRKSGASRGVMVFGKLRIDGVCSGRHVASYAWLNDDGFFTADVWPRGKSSKGRTVGGQLNFLKHGYCPLDLDLVKESDRKWSDEQVLDLGSVEMERLGRDQSRTMSFVVNLPQGVDEAELVLSLRNEKPSGYDWSVQSRLQRTSVDVFRRRVSAGETVEIGDCTSADYALLLKARGCASYKKQIDVTDATMRNLKSIVLPRAKVAKFAIRPFVGGVWETTSVLVDNEQSLRFHDGQSRHRLLLDPFEEAKGIVVSSYYNPSSFDDYGELTTSLLDDQIAKGTVAQPFQLGSGNGRVRFFPGRIYRFRNSYLPIDALIAFLDYREASSDATRATQKAFDDGKAAKSKTIIKPLPSRSFDIGNGVKMEFIECPAGTFMMGAEPSLWKCEELMNEFPKDKTHPLYPHKVKITRPFWMSKYPITFADFDAVVGGEKYKIAQTAFGDRAIIKYTWPDAEKFTAQLTAKLRSKLPKGYVARFPTEAEFEYAMKGGSHKTDDLHWQWFERHLERDEMRGVVFDSCENLVGQMVKNGFSDANQAKRDGGPWVKYNNLSLLGPAGRYKPNGWGFHDMFLGTLCLGGVAHQQSRAFMYRDQETDPLLYMFPPKYRLVYRPFSRGISMRKRGVADTASSAPHAFRVVIGPDLMKEKGLDRGETKRDAAGLAQSAAEISADAKDVFAWGVPMGRAITAASEGSFAKAVRDLTERKIKVNRESIEKIGLALKSMREAKSGSAATRAMSKFESAVKAYYKKYVGGYGKWPLTEEELAGEQSQTAQSVVKAMESVLSDIESESVKAVYNQKLEAQKAKAMALEARYRERMGQVP